MMFNKPKSNIDTGNLNLSLRVIDLMPKMHQIPEEFTREICPWVKFQQRWFYKGLDEFPTAKPGIDQQQAKIHLALIQKSFEPKHEHKQAAVAYLASTWLELPHNWSSIW
jgi:hypothetical protein